jgi:sulfopyruvate decarboxylase TPP-binding subunit
MSFVMCRFSLLKLYPAFDADPDIHTIEVTNEGQGTAICGGIGSPAPEFTRLGTLHGN